MVNRQLLPLAILLVLTDTIRSQVINRANEVTQVNLLINENLSKHNTNRYRQVQYGTSAVLRRGELFNIIIQFKQPYNKANDKARLEFSFGAKPQLDQGTLIYLPIESESNSARDANKWIAKITRITGTQVSVQISLPVNMAIGIWRLRISTKISGTRIMSSYIVPQTLYILFNAWSKNDPVYMSREEARQEYVLNEMGKIYMGSYSSPYGRKWNYGQFHESVLPSVMYLLDKTNLDIHARSDVVRVARAVSAMVNSHDDNGLLVGNWSGNYGDGLAPWQWTGSAAVFDKYLQSGGRPVKFGQCWVFGGVTTTALRTLGIPARAISNFVSAHDTDLSLTVDKFYTGNGYQISGVNGDSVWNFHVWSDAWMARYDLPPGYGGWQAIDATPQETSMDKYQLGPASLEAIKQGKVTFAYDVGFVYSEVNADMIMWRPDDRSPLQWRKTQIQTAHVGRKILTKKIGVLDERSNYGVADAEDIVDQYKYKEGSREERASYREATRSGGLIPLLES